MIQFDANSIKQRLIDRLKAKESWADILFFSTNLRLIEIFAEELAYDMQYDEMLTAEGKWSLARQRASLMAETQFFNYVPFRKVGAVGNIRVSASPTFNQAYPINIDIPKFTTFSNGADISFVTSNSYVLLSNEQYTDVLAVQGKPKSENRIAVGNTFEKIFIYNDSIENTVLDVYVNGTIWTEVANIREAVDGNAKNYVVQTLFDGSGVQISFGNDFFGKKLVAGDAINIRYIETLGANGNVESAGIINKVISTLYIIHESGDTAPAYCTNTEPLVGGRNAEDIEDIRARAPKSYQAGQRAITKEDYESLVNDFDFILKTNVWGEAEVNEDLNNVPGTFIPLEENVVHICAITASETDLTPVQEELIRADLVEKKPPTDILMFELVNFIYMHFTSTLYVSNKKYSLTAVLSNVNESLMTSYSITNMDFKQPVRFSDYVSKLDSVAGVDYHLTTLTFFKYELFNNAYTADIEIYMNDLTPNTVKIYIQNFTTESAPILIAHDNGSGTFVADSGYTLSGDINYTNGLGSLIIEAGPSGGDPLATYTLLRLKIAFALDSLNVEPTKRNQILSYGSEALTAQYI